jgi:hypothetical protein
MPSENVQNVQNVQNVKSQLMHDVYQEEFVYVPFLGTHGLGYEAFTVIRSCETDVVVNFLGFHVSSALGNT